MANKNQHDKTTLPDFLCAGLRVISIGQNPSPLSVQHGYPFANPRNRFWRAFNDSSLASAYYRPGAAAMHAIMRDERIGFTDIVKRPTAGSRDLRSADYRREAPRLATKLMCFRPSIAWFQGMLTYRYYLRFGLGSESSRGRIASGRLEWGLQPDRGDGCRHFVSPNPSAANARYSLAELVGWYNALAELTERLSRAPGPAG